MGLYNPILGDIPTPKANQEVVYNPVVKNSNYKATVTTPLINSLFATTQELTGIGTNSATYTTTNDIILTQIVIQGHHRGATGTSCTSTLDVYIGSLKVFSINIYVSDGVTVVTDKEFNYNIPLENVLIKSNTKLISTSVVSNQLFEANIIFIGYYPNTQ